MKASLENECQPEPCALLTNQYIIIEIALKTFAKPQKLAKLNRKWTIKEKNEEKEVLNGFCLQSLLFSANGWNLSQPHRVNLVRLSQNSINEISLKHRKTSGEELQINQKGTIKVQNEKKKLKTIFLSMFWYFEQKLELPGKPPQVHS